MDRAELARREAADDDAEQSERAVVVARSTGSLPPAAVTMVRVIAAGVYAGGRALMEHRGAPPSNANVEAPAAPAAPAAEVMSVDEAAAFLGLDRNTVYEAAGRNEIPHRRIGKRILLSRSQLVVWLGACKAASGRNG